MEKKRQNNGAGTIQAAEEQRTDSKHAQACAEAHRGGGRERERDRGRAWMRQEEATVGSVDAALCECVCFDADGVWFTGERWARVRCCLLGSVLKTTQKQTWMSGR